MNSKAFFARVHLAAAVDNLDHTIIFTHFQSRYGFLAIVLAAAVIVSPAGALIVSAAIVSARVRLLERVDNSAHTACDSNIVCTRARQFEV